jgi:branched-chain amino acid transport system permease protein
MAPALTRAWPAVALMALTAAVTLLGLLGAESTDRVVVSMLINLILVVGLFAFMGVSGVFSFGHTAFMAVGAYTTALLTIPADLKPLLLPELPGFLAGVELPTTIAILVGALVAGVAAAALALPLMRLTGLMAGLATFAVLIIVNVVAKNWRELTNGTTGMTAVPTTATATGVLLWSFAAIAAAYLFQRSAVGLRLRASREDEVAARASGIRVERERRLAFVLSAVIVGAGGGVFASFLGSFNPDAFFLDITFITIAMLVIGGTKSLAGAVCGTIAVSALSELLRQVEQGVSVGDVSVSTPPGLREVGLALAMLAILLLRPTGITGGRELTWPFREAPGGATPPQTHRERRGAGARLARFFTAVAGRSKGAV